MQLLQLLLNASNNYCLQKNVLECVDKMSETKPNDTFATLANFIEKDGKEKRKILKKLWVGAEEDKEHELVAKSLMNLLSEETGDPYMNIMFDAMSDVGCAVDPHTNIVVKKCESDNPNLMGVFNDEKHQVELCQQRFAQIARESDRIKLMKTTLSHLLIQAYDHCRANVERKIPEHDMCTFLRSSALSGQCSSHNQGIKTAMLFNKKSDFQSCVTSNAMLSFMHKHDSSPEESYQLLEKVFPACFYDYSPHDRLPYSEKQAELSYKAYQTRNRYLV